jgi:hypothetical protein
MDDFPISDQTALAAQYVGKSLRDLPTPLVVLDRSKVKKNCVAMLQVCEKLDVGFRAHVKSHKTLELSQMQVGETGPANFIVSTVVEAERLAPFVKECQGKGRDASVSIFRYPASRVEIETMYLLTIDRYSMVYPSRSRLYHVW